VTEKAPKTIAAFIVSIAEAINIPESKVEDYFKVGEAKDGYFFAVKHEKKWLETNEFKAMCALARDLGGDYIKEEFTWRVPGPLAKKQPSAPQPQSRSEEPSKPTIYVVKPGYYPNFPIDNILSPKRCFRLNIAEGIEELMAEINAAGRIIEPLICKPSSTQLGYVYLGPGERRLLAAKQLGMKNVPIIVDEFTDVEFDRIRLLENIARKDLSDYEMAQALDYLLRTYPKEYPTQEALANDLQKDRTWVTHHLKMLELEKANIVSRDTLEKIDEGHAREILATPEEKRLEVVAQVEEEVKATGKAPSISEMQKISGRREEVVKGPEIVCGLCHTAITSEPTHLDGKFYHEDCAQKVVFKPPDFEPEPVGFEPTTTGMPKKFDKTLGAAAPGPESIEIGEFTCPECNQLFHVEHVSDRKHKLVPVTKA